MKKPSKRSFALAGLLIIPYLINLFGWNLYTYTHIGEDDLIIGISQGLSHNAISEHLIDGDSATALFPAMEELQKELEEMTREFISTDRFKLFAEKRMDPMQFKALNIIESDEHTDYAGFEFSWILVSVIPLLASSLKRKQTRQPGGGHYSGSSAASIVTP